MIVKAIKTQKVLAGKQSLLELLDKYLSKFSESSVLVITSKVVALCENRVARIDGTDKEELVRQEADRYMPSHVSKYGYNFTIKDSTLTSSSGIDESNGDGNYILWPANSQKTANQIRKYLRERFNLQKIGVVITDSTCLPLRWGTVGTALAYSGFSPANDYIGTGDLFGRPFKVSKAGIASGLAAAAVLVMGEGTEQTPLVVIDEVPFVAFQDHDPTPQELDLFKISNVEDDLFAPFLSSFKWLPGIRKGK